MKKIFIFITSILILSLTITAVALFSGVFQKYPTEITISNVSFLYNNTSYLDEISTHDLSLLKGEPEDITLELKTTGSEKIIGNYTVSLYAEETSENNTSLSEAIDLYYFNGYRYEYVSKLSDITSDKKYQISGSCLSNTASTISLQLVYNETINDAYYEESLKNTVTIKTEANAEISLNSEFYTFVDTEEEFKDALVNTTNKEIVLTSDITINNALSGTNNGIDLNGHTLTLNNNVSISFDSNASSDLYIGDLSGNGSIVKNESCLLTISGKAISVSNNFYKLVTVSTDSLSLLKSSLYDVFALRIEEIPTKKEYSIGDYFPLFDGYYQYLGYIEVSSTVLETNDDLYVIKDYSKLAEYSPILYLTINNKKLSNQILLSEIGVNAALSNLKERFNSKVVNYSLPLINYDNKTLCHIEYTINDKNSGIILNSDGIYQASGIDVIKALNSFSIIKPTITVKISYEHSYLTYTLSESETISLFPFTNEQIEALVISNEAKVLVCDPETSTSDTILYYDGDNNAFITNFLSKFDDASITISNVVAGEETYQDNIDVDTTTKTIRAKDIDLNKVIRTYITFNTTFTMDDISFTFTPQCNITLLGKEEYKTRYDISNRLSSKFRENDYISGNGYNFTAYGSLSPTVNSVKTPIYIKYDILTEEAKDYVAIIYQYNIVTKSESQVSYFAKNSDGSYLFSTSELTSAKLDSNDAYFIDITDLKNFDGEKYSISAGVASISESGNFARAYAYEAYIQIKANLVPQVESTIVSIKATLYNDIAYTDPYIENNTGVSYTFTLTVEGIIHYGNQAGNVNDYMLYSKLLLMFDKNNDGLITYSESKQTMSEVYNILQSKGIKDTYYKTISDYSIDYLCFDSLSIDTLAGLENFTNITGISFNSNTIKSVESLSYLHGLKYISFNNNLVTDIESLNLLDDLKYISFDSNLITDISPLKYLSNLEYINLNANKIVDLNGLTLLTNLKYLNLCNMTKNSIEFTNNNTINYELALIQVNSSSAKIYTGTSSQLYSISLEATAAVTILKELERINRVNQKLYLPARYYTDKDTYYEINWTSNDSNLIFTKNGSYYSFSCTNDVINEDVEFYIQVGAQAFQRVMNVNVYKSGNETVYDKYIYNGSGYTNLTTLTNVDKTLIDNLFNYYNLDTSNNTLIEVANGTSVPEQFVISESDFADASSVENIDLSNKGITNLNGLSYFASYIAKNTSVVINLLGNSLDSLEPLSSLDTIGTLKIGSAKYDFNELVSGNQSQKNETTLIQISNLYVNQCYNLSDYDVLKALFRYYFVSTNDINIYLANDSTKWDPYTELLPYKTTLLEDNITIKSIGEYDLTNIFYTDSNGIAIDFYGYTHYFKFDTNQYWSDDKIYTRFSNTQCKNDYFTFLNGVLTYIKYISGNETSYLVATLTSTTNSKKTISTTHTIQINVLDVASNLTVTGLDNGASSTLADMFNSKELKEAILKELASSGFDFSNKEITLTELQSKTSSLDSFTFTQLASNYSSDLFKGLHYLTSLKSITVNYDFYFGSGEELVNLNSITVDKSYVDFSVLTTTLTNLKSLTLKNNYGVILPSKIGDKLPNLSTFEINSFESNYMDLHQLTNLISSEGKSNINTLKLSKVKEKNAPFTIGDVTNIIVPLRNAYFAANNSEPNYYIGTTSSCEVKGNTSKLFFVLNADKTVNYVYVSEDSEENRWNTEVASSDTTIDTNADEDSVSLIDFGLMIGGTAPANGKSWVSLGEEGALKQTLDTTLWLPTNTKYFLYALYNNDTFITNDNLTYSNLEITWYYYLMDSNMTPSKGQITYSETTDGYIKYSLSENAYYILIGKMSGKNLVFTYQFISGSGDDVYSKFTNSNLRFITFYFAELEERVTISNWNGMSLNNGAINHTDFAYYSGIEGLKKTSWGWGSNVYSNTMYISSLKDYETDVINEYLFGDNGKLQSIAIVDLPNAYYDISFTNTFGKLKNVENLTITKSGIKFDSASFNNYTKLTYLDLTSTKNFSPNALESLTKVNTSLTKLKIKDTRCDLNLDTFTVLAKWTSNTNNIYIELNDKNVTTTTAFIKTLLEKIESDLVTDKTYDISKQDNYLGYFYANRTSLSADGYSPSGTTYTINWKSANQFVTNISNVNLTGDKPVEVSVILKDSTLSIFKVPYSLYAYNSTITSYGKFKCDAVSGGVGIEDLNYELISLAIEQGAISYQDGYFVLTKDVVINSNSDPGTIKNINLSNFIITIDGDNINLQLVNGGKKIQLNCHRHNEFYNLYEKNSLWYHISNSYSDTSYTSSDVLSLVQYKYKFKNDSLTTSTNPFIYFDTNTEGNNVILTVTIPANKIVIYGITYYIQLMFEKDDYSDYGIVVNDQSVVIDSAKLLEATKQFEINTTKEIKFKYYCTVNGKTISSNNVFTIYIKHLDSTDTYIDENNLYVKAEKDDEGYYLEKSDTTKVYFDSSKYILANEVDGKYIYSESGKYALIDATYIFESGIFIKKMIDGSVTKESSGYEGINITDLSDDSRKIGKVLTNISSVTELYTNPNNSDKITSIEGIEYFKSLKILQLTGMIYGSLEPISDLKLERFFYATDYSNPYVTVEDFSPLIKGSKDTLVTFQYGAKGNTLMSDLSFLLEFPNLHDVAIENSQYDQGSNKNRYIYTKEFAYLIYQLRNKNINVHMTETHLNYSNYLISGDTTTWWVKMAEINPIYNLGFELLSLYDSNIEKFDKAPTFENDYSIKIDRSDSDTFIYLPATIESNGKLYLLNYTSDSYNQAGFISNLGYYNVSSSSETKVDDPTTLIENNDYYLTYLARTSMLYVKFKVSGDASANAFDKTSFNTIDVSLTCGMDEKKYTLSRRLTINYN